MKRFLGPASVFFLVSVLVVSAAILTGCGKSEDSSAVAPGGGPTMPTSPGMQPGPLGPGGVPRPSGMAGTGGAPLPSGAVAPTGATAPGTSPTTPGAKPIATQPIDQKAVVAFEQVPLQSPVKLVTESEGGATRSVLQFKYLDWQKKVCLCEMPAGEAKVKRTLEAWLATFDVYKKEAPTKSARRKTVERLNDFPFVSPPPAQQPTAQPTYPSGALPPGGGVPTPGMPRAPGW